MNIVGMLLVLFTVIGLKLASIITWSWWLVLFPVYLVIGIFLLSGLFLKLRERNES